VVEKECSRLLVLRCSYGCTDGCRTVRCTLPPQPSPLPSLLTLPYLRRFCGLAFVQKASPQRLHECKRTENPTTDTGTTLLKKNQVALSANLSINIAFLHRWVEVFSSMMLLLGNNYFLMRFRFSRDVRRVRPTNRPGSIVFSAVLVVDKFSSDADAFFK